MPRRTDRFRCSRRWLYASSRWRSRPLASENISLPLDPPAARPESPFANDLPCKNQSPAPTAARHPQSMAVLRWEPSNPRRAPLPDASRGLFHVAAPQSDRPENFWVVVQIARPIRSEIAVQVAAAAAAQDGERPAVQIGIRARRPSQILELEPPVWHHCCTGGPCPYDLDSRRCAPRIVVSDHQVDGFVQLASMKVHQFASNAPRTAVIVAFMAPSNSTTTASRHSSQHTASIERRAAA